MFAAPLLVDLGWHELTEGEVRSAMSELDADGSGDLDREEVRSVMKKMGWNVSEAKLDRIMVDMDRNGSPTACKRPFSLGCVAHTKAVLEKGARGGVCSMMTSYHALNGIPTSAHPIIQAELRERLGWEVSRKIIAEIWVAFVQNLSDNRADRA